MQGDENNGVSSAQELPVPASGSDLGARLVSGLVLAAVSIGVTWSGAKPFAALVLVVALVMCWEWGRVVRGIEFDLTFVVHAVAVAIAVGLAAFGFAALAMAALAIAAIIAVPLQFGDRALMSAAGVLYVGLPAVSMLWLRSDEPFGFLAVLLIFSVVWATDIAAYAAGRTIGGPKLWPSVSPNKTWSGLAGGILAAASAGAAIAHYAGSSIPALAASGAILGIVAQGGDLAESALKRHFGVKDASNLIPGHGGFMDRMDGVVAVAAVAALFALLANPGAPAHALIFGS